MPIALALMSPSAYPAPNALPGTSRCTGNEPSGPAGGVASTHPPLLRRRLLERGARAASSSPEIVSGATSGRAFAAAARAAFDARPTGGSTGSPSIAWIGVASTTLPPYSPIASEIAPITRGPPPPAEQ